MTPDLIPPTTWKLVLRYDPTNKLLRICRAMWTRGEFGEGGYSAKLSLGLHPVLFRWRREFSGWSLSILFLRLHYMRSFGGRFV